MAEADWSALRQQLEGRSAEELLEMLRLVCERSADNRRFVAAHLRGGAAGAMLDEYRAGVESEFTSTPSRSPRLGAARKAIRDYRKATSDLAGTAELMLTYVECGTAFSREHGDMSESYYGSLGLVLRDLVGLVRATPPLRELVLPRLQQLRESSRRVGWTWGGFVRDAVEELERDGAGD